MDILACENISLNHFFILCGDDAIAIKTDKFGLKGLTHNISIHHSGSGNTSNISYDNLRIEDATQNTIWIGSLRIKWTKKSHPGTISSVSFKNIDIHKVSKLR